MSPNERAIRFRKVMFFFTRTSETIEEVGLTAVCLKSIEKATFAGFLIRVRPNKDIINPLFSKYYFRSEHHRQFIVKEMNLVTRASLGQELLKRLPVLLPPLHEQQEISTYLENKCVAIDQSISKKTISYRQTHRIQKISHLRGSHRKKGGIAHARF